MTALQAPRPEGTHTPNHPNPVRSRCHVRSLVADWRGVVLRLLLRRLGLTMTPQQPTGEMAVPADPDPEPRLSTREILRRANPSVDGPTYRYLKGQIDRAEYERQIEALTAPARSSSRSRSCLPLALLGCLVLWGAVGVLIYRAVS